MFAKEYMNLQYIPANVRLAVKKKLQNALAYYKKPERFCEMNRKRQK
jgi:hypothetical protein